MIKVTFIPKFKCRHMSNVSYHFDTNDNKAAVRLAKKLLARDERPKSFDLTKIVITEIEVHQT